VQKHGVGDVAPCRQDLNTREYSIRIVWPDSPTEFPPAELSPVSNTIVLALATARTQFAAIRSAEL
jgi:hypothetical protein